MKGRRIVVALSLQEKALKQVHLNPMGIEKTGLLAHESIYRVNMNSSIEEGIKIVPHKLTLRKHEQKLKQCHTKYQGDHGTL